MIRVMIFLFSLLISMPSLAEKSLNIYAWGGEIPKEVLKKFEQETKITVNFSTYGSNEIMYSKLKTSRKPMYDVVLPSGYFVERMVKKNMLSHLNHKKLPNLSHLNPTFRRPDFDPGNQYSIPIIWGATGIFYNKNKVNPPPTRWTDFWSPKYKNKLLMLDDSREVFTISLLRLGYPPNETNPKRIKKAYQQLLKLSPNIKLFASDNIQSILIDEDALLGSVWNGDAYKARQENQNVRFAFPEEGYVLWVDCLAIPKNPPHPEEAYAFLNFLLRPDVAKLIAEKEGHAITNQTAVQSLKHKSPFIYPPKNILKKGHFQRDLPDETIALYNHYWQKFKLSL